LKSETSLNSGIFNSGSESDDHYTPRQASVQNDRVKIEQQFERL
jgi:hypothetical protein